MHPAPVHVIVNPLAGRYERSGWRDMLRRELGSLGPLRFIVPDTAEGTRRAAAACADSGSRLVVVAGGDGTINQVVNGLGDCRCELGLVPFGTANDLVRQLGLPLSPVAAARVVATGVPRSIDMLRINGRRCVTVGGLAIVAQSALSLEAIDAAPRWVRRGTATVGPSIYRFVAAVNILSRRRIHQRVTVEVAARDSGATRSATYDSHGVFIVNQATLGGGLRLPVAAANDDGVCEIVLLEAGSRWRLLRTLRAFSASGQPPPGAVTALAGREVRIACERTTECVGDGERFAASRAFQVSVEENALLVRAPRPDPSTGPLPSPDLQRVRE